MFLVYLVLGLMNLAGALLCGLGLLFTVPFSMLAMTVAYLMMTGQMRANA
jgi:hypothetical protein